MHVFASFGDGPVPGFHSFHPRLPILSQSWCAASIFLANINSLCVYIHCSCALVVQLMSHKNTMAQTRIMRIYGSALAQGNVVGVHKAGNPFPSYLDRSASVYRQVRGSSR